MLIPLLSFIRLIACVYIIFSSLRDFALHSSLVFSSSSHFPVDDDVRIVVQNTSSQHTTHVEHIYTHTYRKTESTHATINYCSAFIIRQFHDVVHSRREKKAPKNALPNGSINNRNQSQSACFKNVELNRKIRVNCEWWVHGNCEFIR